MSNYTRNTALLKAWEELEIKEQRRFIGGRWDPNILGKSYLVQEIAVAAEGDEAVFLLEGITKTVPGYLIKDTIKYTVHETSLSEDKYLWEVSDLKKKFSHKFATWSMLKIDKVIVNEEKRATTIFFKDGVVKVVKAAADAEFNVYSAVTSAIAQRIYGSNTALKREINEKVEYMKPTSKKYYYWTFYEDEIYYLTYSEEMKTYMMVKYTDDITPLNENRVKDFLDYKYYNFYKTETLKLPKELMDEYTDMLKRVRRAVQEL